MEVYASTGTVRFSFTDDIYDENDTPTHVKYNSKMYYDEYTPGLAPITKEEFDNILEENKLHQ